MPRIRYHVAASLDGYSAGPRGEFDWIVHEPAIDFKAPFTEFDTFIVGRRTFELMLQPDAPPRPPGTRTFVFSRTLPDTVEVAVIPILLGQGLPLLPQTDTRARLLLSNHCIYPSGIVSLEYACHSQ